MKARKAALTIAKKDRKELEKISQSRTAPANRNSRPNYYHCHFNSLIVHRIF
jgi:hypothetical protein